MSTQINNRGDALSAEMTSIDVDQVVCDLATSSGSDSDSSSAFATTQRVAPAATEKAATATATAPAPASRSRGFQTTFSSQAPWPPGGESGPGLTQPKPLPKRPKGRFLVGTILFSVVAAMAWAVWDSFVGVVAYGVVTGDTLQVRAPWDGIVSELLVEDGAVVERGQLLAVLHSPELIRRREQLRDELRVEQSRIPAETERLRREAQVHAAEYFELQATLQQTTHELRRSAREVERARKLDQRNVMSQHDLDRLVFEEAGLRDKVSRLERAVEELRQLAEPRSTDADGSPTHFDQLQPVLARIELLQSELLRIEEQLEEGRLLSPVDGIAVRPGRPTGQQLARLEAVLEIIDRPSLRITLFVPQDDRVRSGESSVLCGGIEGN